MSPRTPWIPSALVGLLLLTLANFAAGASGPRRVPHLPARLEYFSPGDRHKVQVSDPVLTQRLTARGARPLAVYRESVLLEVTGLTARELLGREGVEVRDEYNLVLLNAGPLDTSAPGVRALRTRPAPGVAAAEPRMHLVQFAGPVKPEWLKELQATGVRVVTYLPHNAYLVYGTGAAIARAQALARGSEFVQWDGAWLDVYKVDPVLRANPRNRPAAAASGRTFVRGGERVSVQLVEDPGANARTLQALAPFLLEPIRSSWVIGGYRNFVAALTPQGLAGLTARPDVVSIQGYVVPEQHDERQNRILAADLTGGVPNPGDWLQYLADQGFDGSTFGFVVNVSDSGIDNGTTTPNHFGLYKDGDVGAASPQSRVVYTRLEGTANAESTLAGRDGHGTVDAHIVGGYVPSSLIAGGFPHADSSGFRHGIGVAPFVQLGSSVIFDPAFTSPNYSDLESRAYRDGARISTNSWGSNVSGAYTANAQTFDYLVRDAQQTGSAVPAAGDQEMVIVFSAGNRGASGFQTIGAPGSAKNVITVGAAENVRAFGGADRSGVPDSMADSADDMATFSSRGPCADGRVKPDLTAPGTHIGGGVWQTSRLTPAAGGNGAASTSFDGTGVSGGVGSKFFPAGQEWYTASSGTSQACPAVAGAAALIRQKFLNEGRAAPSPALTKSCLLNTARYLTGTGANDALPSHNQGMGGANLAGVFDLFTTPSVLRDQSGADTFTASGQVRTFTGQVSDSGKPFRVTLAWTDAPGPTSGAAYVNNLDLEVTVGGRTYKGNVFQGPASATGGTADVRNNVESVFLPAGVSGPYQVRVTATNIAGDGVPGSEGALDQDFALVLSNAVEEALPVVALTGAALTAESCSPANGAPDPGEQVTMAISLANVGLTDTTDVVATLAATGGVVAPSGPQSYGALAAGAAAVTRPFTFVASGACGAPLTLSLALQDGATSLGTVTVRLVTGVLATSFVESFDGVTAPALPGGWTTEGSSAWTTVTTSADSSPNAAFTSGPNNTSNALVSPAIPIASESAQLTFRHRYNLESGFDGGALEIKIGAGSFQDILIAGGSFVAGGYVRRVTSLGRQAWSGDSGGFVTTTVTLPATASGQNIQLRWRCGTDNIVSSTGWWVDSIFLQAAYDCCAEASAVQFSAVDYPVDEGGAATVTVTRVGPLDTEVTVDYAAGDGSAGSADYHPASGTLTFPAGVTSRTFAVDTKPDDAQEGDETIDLTLSNPSSTSVGARSTATVTITDYFPALTALTVAPASVRGGNAAVGKVTLGKAAPAGGAAVSLASGHASASVPASVTVPAGKTEGSFTITTGGVAADTAVTLTASRAGTDKTADLTVEAPELRALTLTPGRLVGGRTVRGRVFLDASAPAAGTLVALSTTNAAASVPPDVTVSAGQRYADFDVDTTAVTADTAGNVVATLGGGSRTAGLTVLPLLAGVAMSQPDRAGGSPRYAVVTLNGPAPKAGAVVDLSSSSPALVPPAQVTLAAGRWSLRFLMASAPVASDTEVTLTASHAGRDVTGTGKVLAPRLVRVRGRTSAVGGTTVRLYVDLDGPAPAGGVAVSLSSDDTAASVPAQVTVPAGAATAMVPVRLSRVSGQRTATVTATLGGVSRTLAITVTL